MLSLKNKGYSLVEIIIVVAMISVLTGVMAIGVNSVVSKPADECAQKLVGTLRNAKISAMGKNSYKVLLTQESSGAIINIEEVYDGYSNKYQIGNKNISVTIVTKNSSFDLSSVNSVEFKFNRETGGLYESVYTPDGGAQMSDYVKSIIVKKGDKSHTIGVSYLTGKFSID